MSSPPHALDLRTAASPVRRPIVKTLLANARLCPLMARKAIDGLAPDKPWEPPTGAALLGIALHRALATVFRVWMRGDHVNTDSGILTRIWAGAWSGTGSMFEPDPEGPDRMRMHEDRFVGPRRKYRVISVERRLRAPYEEFMLEATPDVLAVSVGDASHLLALEHSSAQAGLASVEGAELTALLVQFVVGHSPTLPPSVRELARAVVWDDLNTGTQTPITVGASRGAVLLDELARQLRALIAAPDPTALAAPSESACSRCVYSPSCAVAWRPEDEAFDGTRQAP